MDKKVWIITGCSKGLGLELCRTLLENDQYVVATSRRKEDLIEKIGAESDSFLPVTLNLNDEDDIKQKVELAKNKFGRIDVLVNNAGYQHLGTIEDSSDKEVRACFDVNFFATVNMIRAIVPIMRQQQSGHIFNTSSVAGLTADGFGSIYSATKFAVNAISYGLAAELKPFGVHVTNVIPGYFRTEFLNPNSYSVSNSSSPYSEMSSFVDNFLAEKNGTQAGDPHKAALLYLKVSYMNNPPLDLPMGNDAYDAVVAVSNQKLENLNTIKELTLSTDFDV